MGRFFVRHGEPDREIAKTTADPRLSERRHGQAAAMVDVLAAERIDAIHVSSMQRARETGAPHKAAHSLVATPNDDLREWDADEDVHLGGAPLERFSLRPAGP